MKVTYAAVISVDGRITRGDDPHVHAWSSAEDWRHFEMLRDAHDAVVIDRTTYETIKPEPEPARLRVVLTNHPALYAAKVVTDQLEFMRLKPRALVAALQKRGKQRLMVAGGSTLSYEFFKAGLINDVYITVEPLLFGAGTTLLAAAHPLSTHLQLVDVKRLNDGGTLLLHYTVAG